MKQVMVKYPNKLRAVFATRPSKMVSVSVSINAGVEQETKSISGVSHLIERLIRSEVIKNVSEFGGVVDTFTDYNQISFTISTQREFLKESVEVLSNAIFNFYPKFESFEREKKKVLVEIEKNTFNPFAMLNTLTQSIMYKGTNLANDELGSVKSISQISLDDVKDFYTKILSPDDIIISFVGDVGDFVSENEEESKLKQDPKSEYTLIKKQVENYWDYPYETDFVDKNDHKMVDTFNFIQDLVNKYFYLRSMKLTSKSRTKNVKYVTPEERTYVFKPKSLNQTRFQISFPSAPYNSTAYKYAKLFENYLSLYLRTAISKMGGGVYGVEVTTNQFKNNAHLSISFAVDNEVACERYDKILSTLIGLRQEGINKEEFFVLKNTYKTNVAIAHDSTLSLAKRFNKWVLLKNQLFNLQTEVKIINSLNFESYDYISKKILDFSKMVVVVMGRKNEKFKPFKFFEGV